MYYFRYFLYLIVFIGFSVCNAGSYDEFFIAIKQDNGNWISRLLSRGFDPNTVNPEGQYGLVLALRDGSLNAALALIAHPATQVEVRTAENESPLMLAALRGHTAVCEKLIARDADVNKPGWAPLHYAATGGHLEVARLLLQEHAYIDADSPNGSTPLMMAAMYGTTEVVKLLLDSGADPSLKNSLGLTAADFADKANHTDSATLIRLAMQTGVLRK